MKLTNYSVEADAQKQLTFAVCSTAMVTRSTATEVSTNRVDALREDIGTHISRQSTLIYVICTLLTCT